MSGDERSFEDLLNQAEAKKWLARAEREMFPKMKASVFSLIINSEKPDAKLAIEVGAAILFDKPLIVAVQKGQRVPPALVRIATRIIEVEFGTDAGLAELADAIKTTVAAAEGK